jgi:pyruvate formate lyase activating enzyme
MTTNTIEPQAIHQIPATGLILHLQRLSTEDGPGIRTSVFFKGCPLHCEWCHNPESISLHPQVHWLEERCIGCDTCQEACPKHGLWRTSDGLEIDRQVCDGCGACAEACPSNAIELLGKRVSAAELLQELLKDRTYFEKSNGGVTLTGGEPAMQPGFAASLLHQLKEAIIHTAVDTSGLCSAKVLEKLLDGADLILYDLKEIEPERHRQYTGQDNHIIIQNLLYLRQLLNERWPNKELWIRTPIIPGRTARPDNIRAIGAFIHSKLDGLVARWELCAFNNLCRDKYSRLGQEWAFASTPLLPAEELESLAYCARQSGVPAEIVFATGATQLEHNLHI